MEEDPGPLHMLEEALSEAGFGSCDVVVVAMGSNLEACILATMALKELKVPRVIAKALGENAGKVATPRSPTTSRSVRARRSILNRA